MGIKDIKNILNKYCPEGITKVKLSTFRKKIIAIDISIFLYQYKYAYENFIDGMIKLTMKLLKNEITPLFIFDGKPTKEKNEVIKQRIQKRNVLKEKIKVLQEIVDDEKRDVEEKEMVQIELDQNKKNMICVKNCDKILCIKFFDLVGVPYIIAQGEAEILCARLTQRGLAYATISNDSDLMPNNNKISLKNFSVRSDEITQTYLPIILEKLAFTYPQFVDMCILCGCDYVDRLPNIGPITAHKLIKKLKTIENMMEHILDEKNIKKYKKETRYAIQNKDDDGVMYHSKVIHARELFMSPFDDIYDYEELRKSIKIHKPNINELDVYLKKETSISEKEIKSLMKILGHKKQSAQLPKNQRSIASYFNK